MYTKVMTSQEKPAKILAFVGLPGAGKTEATNFVAAKGFPKIYGGGILYDEMRARGVKITPESQAEFRKQWRERDGKDVIIRRAAEQLHRLIDAGQHRLLFDGLYSWTEYKFLKHEFPGELIVAAIVAPKHLRHRRLATRPERPFTAEQANQRDWSEIEDIEKGGPIAIADYYLTNDSDITALYAKINSLLSTTGFVNV